MSVINGKTLMKGWLSPRRCPVIWPSFIQHGYICVAIALSVPGKIVSKSRYLGHADGIVASPRRHLAKNLSSLVGTRHVEVDRNRGVKIILGRCSQDELIQQPFGVSNSILLFQLNTHRVVSDLAKIIRLACVARQKLYFLFASLTYSLALHVVV